MKYFEPRSMAEALKLLAADPESRCLAGGATLVAMLNADLVEPTALVSLKKISGLSGIAMGGGGGVRIGAMTRHADIENARELAGNLAVVRNAAAQIAHPAIRAMGTIGGAICHGDPSADFPSALVAADAIVEAQGPAGKRDIPIGEFFVGYFTTALEPGEIVTAIVLPKARANSAGLHVKFNRVDGDYATVAVSLALAIEKGVCAHARIALAACGPVPVAMAEADHALEGSKLDAGAIAKAATFLVEASDPVDDVRGSAEYRRMLIPRLLSRAVGQARAELESAGAAR